MIDRELYDVFDDCVNRLAAGQTVEDCLRAHPRYAAVLRPMLEAGRLARRAAYPSPEVLAARDRGQFRLEAAMSRALPGGGGASRTPLLRLVASLAAVLALFVVVAGGVAVAAESSLPGEPLYGIKRTTEQVRLSLSNDAPALAGAFDQRRLEETRQLLALGRQSSVTFRGLVQAIDADAALWLVEGLTLSLEAGTDSPADVLVGSRVEVDALTQADGRLIARAIRLLDPPQTLPVMPSPVPSLTQSPTVSPTHTPSPADSPAPSATITETRTPEPSATRRTRPTATPSQARAAAESPTPCRVQPPDGWTRYVVQPGDRLSGLAQRSGTTVERLIRVNCIRDPNVLTVGAVLFLPSEQTVAPTGERTPIPDTRPSERPAAPPTNTPFRR